MLMISLRHARMIRRAGGRPLCAGGIEAWCKRHNVDWEQFSGEGVTEARMLEIDDHYAQLVIEIARKEREDGQR